MKALFMAVINGMETKTFTKENGETFDRVIIKRDYNEPTEPKEYAILRDIVFDLTDEMKTDTAYEITKTACDCLADALANEDEMTEDEFSEWVEDEFSEWVDGLDFYEVSEGCEPIYTGELLALLCGSNQSEISEMVKNNFCDISEACAWWYGDKVRETMQKIINETA